MVVHVNREQENRLLRENGYRWTKPNGTWQLIDPVGKPVDKLQALSDIEHGSVSVPVPEYNHIDRPSSIRWAQRIISLPQTERRVIILDTETSGLGEQDVVVEVSAVDLVGRVVFDSLVCPPDGVNVNEDAAKTHGIASDELYWAEPFDRVWEKLQPILLNSEIIIFNAAFDTRLLKQTVERNDVQMPALITHCLMKQFASFYGELVPGNKDVYKSQKLEKACECFGIVPGGHRALADAQASLKVLQAMADYRV